MTETIQRAARAMKEAAEAWVAAKGYESADWEEDYARVLAESVIETLLDLSEEAVEAAMQSWFGRDMRDQAERAFYLPIMRAALRSYHMKVLGR